MHSRSWIAFVLLVGFDEVSKAKLTANKICVVCKGKELISSDHQLVVRNGSSSGSLRLQ